MPHSDDTPRAAHLKNIRRIVVKVGSAVLTSPDGLDHGVITHLCGELAALHARGMDVILVTSAAVAAGRSRLRRQSSSDGQERADLSDLPGRQAASAVGQGRLMHEYDQVLEGLGIVSAQVLLTRTGLKNRERFLNARNTLERLLEWRVVPIINENDTVSVEELEFGDNDTLASMVAGLIGADLCLNLTSADGVFDHNPDTHPGARALGVVDNIAELDIPAMCEGKTAVGSGGMYSKLLAARRAAQVGAPTIILSGKGAFSLARAVDGHETGTLVLPTVKHVSSKKFWLAYHDNPCGALFVDAGAENALRTRGKSLLFAGITRVEGDFDHNALVAIKNAAGRTLGVGLANYPSHELEKVRGRQSSEVAGILGRAPHNEAVHRDNLLLDPAIKE
jgi:glutamate 5-kinase